MLKRIAAAAGLVAATLPSASYAVTFSRPYIQEVLAAVESQTGTRCADIVDHDGEHSRTHKITSECIDSRGRTTISVEINYRNNAPENPGSSLDLENYQVNVLH